MKWWESRPRRRCGAYFVLDSKIFCCSSGVNLDSSNFCRSTSRNRKPHPKRIQRSNQLSERKRLSKPRDTHRRHGHCLKWSLRTGARTRIRKHSRPSTAHRLSNYYLLLPFPSWSIASFCSEGWCLSLWEAQQLTKSPFHRRSWSVGIFFQGMSCRVARAKNADEIPPKSRVCVSLMYGS